tara:strand:+ start:412 stop:1170 length:759 start_codon:yes stop_codon:yes gene_type:complete
VIKKNLNIVAIIPSRLKSTRLPNKPLILFKGIPMIEHVRRRTILCKHFDKVVVATCDKKIFDLIESFGGHAMMTSKKHLDCTDRLVEASKKIQCTHVVNVQGDNILVDPKDLENLCKAINLNPHNMFWNMISKIENSKDLSDKSVVKCFISNKKLIYFLFRNYAKEINNVYRVQGLLAYTKNGLSEFGKMKPTINELKYSIEQFRIIENDNQINTINTQKYYSDINRYSDIRKINKILKTDKYQKRILNKIL